LNLFVDTSVWSLALRRDAPPGDPEVAQLARAAGSRSLREDGLIKAWRGVTSLEEVLRVTGLDAEGG